MNKTSLINNHYNIDHFSSNANVLKLFLFIYRFFDQMDRQQFTAPNFFHFLNLRFDQNINDYIQPFEFAIQAEVNN